MDASGVLKHAWTALVHTVSRPFVHIEQAWSDYQKGRFIRKEVERSHNRCINKEKANSTEHDRDDTEADRKRRSWAMRLDHEYPWRIERDIQVDINCKATWVLEVKDIYEIEWDTRRIHDGRRWRWHSIPQGRWPFPYERTPVDDEEEETQKIGAEEKSEAKKRDGVKNDEDSVKIGVSEDTKC